MFLHREDIEKINELIKLFPDVDTFELESDTSSGIGAHITLKAHTSVNGVEGVFEMVVASVENW